jgi:GNAT superfamily N-acetyltransferase
VGVADDAFDDGAVVELPGPPRRPARWQVEVHVPVAGRAPSRVLVSPDVAPSAPHLWTVLMPSGAEHGDQVDLVAFSTADHPAGTVVGRAGFEALDISWANQVGAVRWSASTGVVGQVYVAPEHRRLRVASTLLMVAAGIRVALGWPSLRSDGRLTDLGDAWLTRAPDWWRSRVPARVAQLPPMTPPARTDGVPVRNLVPDEAPGS